jgi:hypothetical protein
MNNVIRQGVKTKVLMLSATPVNNRFNDLKNQLALAYEGDSENLSKKLSSNLSVEEIFRRAQAAFNNWVRLPVEQRTAEAILNALDFDFFELLDSVTIARSRKHIQSFYDTQEIGHFPERRKPLSFRCPLTNREDVFNFNEIYSRLSQLKLSVYAPINYIFPSRLTKYEELYDTLIEGGKGRLRQADRERSLQALMTTNLLKRLESSVESFRLTLRRLHENYSNTLDKIEVFKQTKQGTASDCSDIFDDFEIDEDDLSELEGPQIGGKVKINLEDMDLPSWENDLREDQVLIDALLESMDKVQPANDSKLQHLKQHILNKIQAPINGGNKKILIFTAYADTAKYLFVNIAPYLMR